MGVHERIYKYAIGNPWTKSLGDPALERVKNTITSGWWETFKFKPDMSLFSKAIILDKNTKNQNSEHIIARYKNNLTFCLQKWVYFN